MTKINLVGMPYNFKKLIKKEVFCGHINYSAPEMIEEQPILSTKIDIWSLGCCLYYLSTKNDPFEGRNPKEIKYNIMNGLIGQSKIHPILNDLINACTEIDHEKRMSA